MTLTLQELVSAALSQSSVTPSGGVKLASAADVPRMQVADAVVEKRAQAKVASESHAPVQADEILTDSAYAMKIASALEVAAQLTRQKLAENTLTAPSPLEAFEATNNRPESAPQQKKEKLEQSVTSAPITAGMPGDNQDAHTGNVDWTNNKEAADAMIRHKVAQAELLGQLGHHVAAAEVLREVEGMKLAHNKVARLRSRSRQKLAERELTVDPAVSHPIPDNSGLIDMTQGQARKKTQEEAASFVATPVKKDPILSFAASESDSAKVSSAIRSKLAAKKRR